MSRLRDGEAPRIFGDGRQTRDYVFAGDVAEATLAALDADGGVYNIGTGRETSVLELLERIEAVAGREATPEFVEPRPGELRRSVLDVSRSADELGWRPRHTLDEGLAETWTWITS